MIKERKIGFNWNDMELSVPKESAAQYTNSGLILVTSSTKVGNQYYLCWFKIVNHQKMDQMIYSKDDKILGIIQARQAPIIAVEIYKLVGSRAALDLNGVSRIVVHDLNTHKILLTTPNRTNMIGCALSSDGRTLAVLTEKKLEVYSIPILMR